MASPATSVTFTIRHANDSDVDVALSLLTTLGRPVTVSDPEPQRAISHRLLRAAETTVFVADAQETIAGSHRSVLRTRLNWTELAVASSHWCAGAAAIAPAALVDLDALSYTRGTQ